MPKRLSEEEELKKAAVQQRRSTESLFKARKMKLNNILDRNPDILNDCIDWVESRLGLASEAKDRENVPAVRIAAAAVVAAALAASVVAAASRSSS